MGSVAVGTSGDAIHQVTAALDFARVACGRLGNRECQQNERGEGKAEFGKHGSPGKFGNSLARNSRLLATLGMTNVRWQKEERGQECPRHTCIKNAGEGARATRPALHSPCHTKFLIQYEK